MRVCVLWTSLTGYVNSCLRLLALDGNDIFVASAIPSSPAPYEIAQFEWMRNLHYIDLRGENEGLVEALKDFRPEVIVICGWRVPSYRRIARVFAGRAVRVMTMDNQWHGTARQRVGCALSGLFVQPLCDYIFVAGERQAELARRLGFSQDRIRYGVYSCDVAEFTKPTPETLQSEAPAFLYFGRLVSDKGIDTLVEAYTLYRQSGSEPWPLRVAGTGPLSVLLEDRPGVDLLGFIQPHHLPSTLWSATCALFPSRVEPWGVALHEAAAAGLPLIATHVCGAAVHMVQDSLNGYLVDPDDPWQLARAMVRIQRQSCRARSEMGRLSRLLAMQYTPERWARTLTELSRSAGARTERSHIG